VSEQCDPPAAERSAIYTSVKPLFRLSSRIRDNHDAPRERDSAFCQRQKLPPDHAKMGGGGGRELRCVEMASRAGKIRRAGNPRRSRHHDRRVTLRRESNLGRFSRVSRCVISDPLTREYESSEFFHRWIRGGSLGSDDGGNEADSTCSGECRAMRANDLIS